VQYQRLGLSYLGRALLDQGFAATSTSTHNIACKPLPYVFAEMGLRTLIPASSEPPLNTLLFSIYDFTIFCKSRKAFLR